VVGVVPLPELGEPSVVTGVEGLGNLVAGQIREGEVEEAADGGSAPRLEDGAV